MNSELKPELWAIIIANTLVLSLFFYFAVAIYPRRELSEETKKRSRSWISNAIFREFWYFLMGPMKRKLLQWGVEPNTITWIGFWLSVGSAYLFAVGEWGWAAWVVILASTMDVYDGMLARARKVTLKSGSFLDSTLDRLGESAMFFGLTWYFRFDNFWFVVLFLAFTSSQVTSYARARGEGLGFHGARGFFQRAERMIVLSVGMGFCPVVEIFDPTYPMILVKFTIGFLTLGSLQTVIARSVDIYREIRATEK